MDERPAPVSTRHAFALAADLAFRRDPLQSILVPFLLRSPWLVALALLPSPESVSMRGDVLIVWSVATLGLAFAWLLVDAMLRFRARSVFDLPRGAVPASAGDCYAAALGRVGWLYLTEFVRSLALLIGYGFFVVPGVWLSYRLAFATEAVVLTERDLARAFRHSWRLSRRRFERWIEMIVVSVALVLGACLVGGILAVAISSLTDAEVAGLIGTLLVVLVWPVFQYAWTFFFLRLLEVELPEVREVGPTYATIPPTGPVEGPAMSAGVRPSQG